jgi:ubiquinone biosynthesis monooxygenase Coq7
MLFAQGLRRFCANKIAPSKLPRKKWQIRAQNNSGASYSTTYQFDDRAKQRIQTESVNFSPSLWADLRSDHAGETGAVWIYKGAKKGAELQAKVKGFKNLERLAIYSKSWNMAIDLILTHEKAEQLHLDYMNEIVPKKHQSKLLGPWKLAGFLLGLFPTLFFGPRALFITINAVEIFVENHYMEQIEPLRAGKKFPELTRLLEHCCEEEILHQKDAQKHYFSRAKIADPGTTPKLLIDDLNAIGRLWFKIVALGSATAVKIAKRM